MTKRLKITSYRRTLATNLARMFENVFDWEHLPHLHPKSFSSVTCSHQGSKSLICKVGLVPQFLGLSQTIQVYACPKRGIWIVTVKKGFMGGLSIYSRVVASDKKQLKIEVNFFAPVRHFYWILMAPLLWLSYRTIYSEDESMMKTRQKQLDRLSKPPTEQEESLFLGHYSQIIDKLPLFFDLNNHTYGLTLFQDQLLAYDSVCPHMLRPLEDVSIKNGVIRCPWHGYEFSIKTRSCSRRPLALGPAPDIQIIDDKVYAAF